MARWHFIVGVNGVVILCKTLHCGDYSLRASHILQWFILLVCEV